MTVSFLGYRAGTPAPSAFEGEIRQFASGFQPDGWVQVSGPDFSLNNLVGVVVEKCPQLEFKDVIPSTVVAASQTFFPLPVGGDRAFVIFTPTAGANPIRFVEVDESFRPQVSASSLPMGTWSAGSLVASNFRAAKIPGGDLLFQGTANATRTALTQRYNVATRAFSVMPNAPVTPSGLPLMATGADGNVYARLTGTTGVLDRFNTATNTWSAGVATCPLVPTYMAELPSGKIILGTTTPNQHVIFDPAANTFSAVVESEVVLPALGINGLTTTTAGARGYSPVSIPDGPLTLVAVDFIEADGSFSVSRVGAVIDTSFYVAHSGALTLADGAHIIYVYTQSGAGRTITHYRTYVPRGVAGFAKT